MKLNKVLKTTMEIVYARPKSVKNFVKSVAEKYPTCFTAGQCANCSIGLQELPLINDVCFVRT